MSDEKLPGITSGHTDAQRMFIRYFTATLIDLVVLNLFDEYSDRVTIDTFTTSLLVAIVLQFLLKLTIAIEHRVAQYFKSRPPSGMNTFMRYFSAWLLLFGSKFVILEAITLGFGDKVDFAGRWEGLVTLIVVIVVMLVAEEIVVRIYRALGARPA